MEIRVAESIRIPVEESSQTAEARRTARKIAVGLGFDVVKSEQVAIVVTEACTNILKHADRGEILFNASNDEGGGATLEMIALDRGQGMSNLDQCMADGYSTGSSPGQGLGAIVRLSAESDFFSAPGKGTAILARWTDSSNHNSSPAVNLGAVNVNKPGQEVCGDSWGIETGDGQFVVMVADGLGHGLDAKTASMEAIRILHDNPDLSPKMLLERTHQALRTTRGAAVSVARVDYEKGKLSFAGVGNVFAQIYAGSEAGQHLVTMNGTAGHHSQRLQEFSYPWPQNGLLMFYSDGLLTGTGLSGYPGLALRDPALIAGVLYRDFSRRHDDSTVVIAKTA
jgi:anti-sigma regulatory factor (Ser/Thr protein kinase)